MSRESSVCADVASVTPNDRREHASRFLAAFTRQRNGPLISLPEVVDYRSPHKSHFAIYLIDDSCLPALMSRSNRTSAATSPRHFTGRLGYAKAELFVVIDSDDRRGSDAARAWRV